MLLINTPLSGVNYLDYVNEDEITFVVPTKCIHYCATVNTGYTPLTMGVPLQDLPPTAYYAPFAVVGNERNSINLKGR